MNRRKHLLITGSTIGRAIATLYADDPAVEQVWLTWRTREPADLAPGITPLQMDVTDEASVADGINSLEQLDGVLNTVGVLHHENLQPEKAVSRFSPESFLEVMTTNTLPTLLLAKHARKLLRRSDAAWFAAISARVGSIEENGLGGWYSYRASKAALNMALKTLSLEWKIALPDCPVAALHPGTVASPLSEPFTRSGADRRIFTPEESAAYLKANLDKLTPALSGRFWSWDGTELPW